MVEPLQSDVLQPLGGIQHGFFTRQGGVSTGIYASLNTGLGSADNKDAVMENRSRVAAALGAGRTNVVTVYQVHSANSVVIDKPPTGELPRADSIVTKTRGLVIGVLAADCAPVLFADPVAGIVAAAHAGWRGALGGVLEATLERMKELGALTEHIHATIGPCISQMAYEVGPEFQQNFEATDPDSSCFFTRAPSGTRPHFDLPGYIHNRLARTGLGGLARLTPCTYANEDRFFSFRRTTHQNEPDYGRHISAIVLTER